MSVTKTIEIEAKVDKAEKDLEGVAKRVQKIDNNLEDVRESSNVAARGIKGIGNALKAAGIGLAIAAFTKLGEVFNQNQKVTNFFSTTFEALSLAFNDFFNFLDQNIGTATGFIDSIFGNEIVKKITEFSYLIGVELITRVKNLILGIGGLGQALFKVFSGKFGEAYEIASEAVGNLGDVIVGNVEETAEMDKTIKKTTKSIVDYTKSTIKAAKGTVDLNRQAQKGIAQNRIILEQKDREAEKLRQIRDDESRTIEERIEANDKLAKVLDEQEKLMLANADAVIAAAQAQFDKNKNDENEIALLEARAEKEGILAQIEGFRSEQLMNVNSLKREQNDLTEEGLEKEVEAAEKRKELLNDNIKALRDAAGHETAIGKALFIAKQAMLVKEQIAEAKATLSKITLKASAASVDLSSGAAKTASALPFPANIPLIIGFAAQAVGIFSSIKAAVNATKGSASKMGGTGSSSSVQSPRISATSNAPAFNIVGASETNQLAQAIGQEEKQPVKAYVVSNDVSTAQALDRNIVETASIG